ncbi:MAG: hypothetical protein ACKO0V_03420, partial [bacterium]
MLDVTQQSLPGLPPPWMNPARLENHSININALILYLSGFVLLVVILIMIFSIIYLTKEKRMKFKEHHIRKKLSKFLGKEAFWASSALVRCQIKGKRLDNDRYILNDI